MVTHKTYPAHMDRLLAPERYEQLDILRIFSLLPLAPYQTVADIGCGPGFFTIPLAKALWDGKVYALDIQEEMVEACRRRVAEARLGNVEVIRSEATTLQLESASLDGALVALVLHSQVDKAGFLKSIMDTLKPGGWLALINWHLVPEPTMGPPPERRVPVEEVLRLVEETGFRLNLRRELNEQQYLLVLRK